MRVRSSDASRVASNSSQSTILCDRFSCHAECDTPVPALHRLQKSGGITSKWEQADRGREMRQHRLTPESKREVQADESNWAMLARAMARMLKPF